LIGVPRTGTEVFNERGIIGREESVFSRPSPGGLGGGGVEKTPAGDYSINTHLLDPWIGT
jgi:hypothetical protein